MNVAATAEASRGWGGPAAPAVAVAVFWMGCGIYRRWKEWLAPPSPTAKEDESPGVKAQVNEVPDTDDTDDDPDHGVVQHGAYAIDYSDGRNRVKVRVRKTGEHQQSGDLDGWVKSQLGRMCTSEIVREAGTHWRVSKSTVMRAIRRAREWK